MGAHHLTYSGYRLTLEPGPSGVLDTAAMCSLHQLIVQGTADIHTQYTVAAIYKYAAYIAQDTGYSSNMLRKSRRGSQYRIQKLLL